MHENRLARETSPYLLQHRHNPVDWWPWGPDALAHARIADKPILLSVGYAACHWCHVMAHESFEDPQTAAVMNELFVNIKVDREERPDIDQIYMSALHLLGEQGGWPLTMFLTPTGEPIWGGTYFPKTSRYGRPAFVDVLREFARLYRQEPHRIEQNRTALMARLRERTQAQEAISIGLPQLDALARRLVEQMDPVNGGLRGAPKFPQPTLFEFLWRAGERTGDARLFAAVELALERICLGGLFDHLAGGFARYSVDERWLVPHFEKMLYDNALLLDLLAVAHARSAKALYRDSMAKTVAWLRAEMMTPQGAFCSSLDADSEGEEGRYYVWTLPEIEAALGPNDAAFFAAHYGVSASGNFEGKNILNRLHDLPCSTDDQRKLSMLRSLLHQERSKRVRPGLDDKVLADWNGLMIAALARAGSLLAEPAWIALAEQAYRFVAAAMTVGDRLGHSWRENRFVFPGLASDYAAMIAAALALFEATGEEPYRDQAATWQAALDRHHTDPATGGYFLTADDAEGLVVRLAATTDDATPNPNAIVATNLIRLATLSGGDAYREQADRLFDGLLPAAAQSPLAHAGLLNALDLRLRAAEIVVTGHGPRSEALAAAALRIPPTRRILLRAPNASALGPSHPVRDRLATAPDGAAFVCLGERCSLPLTDPERLPEAFAGERPRRSDGHD